MGMGGDYGLKGKAAMDGKIDLKSLCVLCVLAVK
jgi:hypothetical protein